jgi:hypothetical protein
VGFLLSLGSTFRLLQLLKGNPEPFATMYTIGNIIGMCSTCFLYGPWSQAKKMFAPTRYVPIFYLELFFTNVEIQVNCDWRLFLLHGSHALLRFLPGNHNSQSIMDLFINLVSVRGTGLVFPVLYSLCQRSSRELFPTNVLCSKSIHSKKRSSSFLFLWNTLF